jgi:hypothetical protein
VAAKKVQPIHIGKVEKWLNDKSRQRFRELWQLLVNPPMAPSSDMPHSDFASRHTELLAACDICEPADTTTASRGAGIPFMVVEDKLDDNHKKIQRLRFIFWTKRHTEALLPLYECDVPLAHVSRYVDAAREQSGATADLASGFFQVELPPEARAWYRFNDATGKLWQLKRMPMGIRIAVEIMQIVSEAIVGSQRVCHDGAAIKGILADAWVDDIRVAGDTERVERAVRLINDRATECGATFKAPLHASSAYDFIGVHFDHDKHNVSVAEKTRAKLPLKIAESLTAGEIERLVSRLIWCAGVVRIPLATHYFVIKWAARVCNKLNRGLKDVDDVVQLPPSVRTGLIRWKAESLQQRVLKRQERAQRHATLFTDASLRGCGAVFIDENDQVFVAGRAWTDDDGVVHFSTQ